MMSTYHNILGIDSNADKKTIRKAYHRLSLIHHPDKGGDNDKFLLIKEAYENLTIFNPNTTHNYYEENNFVSIHHSRSFLKSSGDIEIHYVISNIYMIRLLFEGKGVLRWYANGFHSVSLLIPRSHLVKSNYTLDFDFTSNNGKHYSNQMSFKDKRNWLRKILDKIFI